MSELTPKQEQFAQLYVELGNASEAYRKAYDKANLDPSQSSTRAYELLQNSYIAKRVEELKEELKEKHNITKDTIIKGYLEIISDADYTFSLGKLKNADKEETKRFYRLMQLTKNSDKIRALENLTKLLGLDEPSKSDNNTTVRIIEHRNDKDISN